MTMTKTVGILARRSQDRPKTGLGWPQICPRPPKMVPEWLRRAPRRPKTGPRQPKTSPRQPQNSPRWFQNAQECPRMHPESIETSLQIMVAMLRSFSTFPTCPKLLQECPSQRWPSWSHFRILFFRRFQDMGNSERRYSKTNGPICP